MYNRKQNVIKMAHQLFVEKGFHATSIQDILDYSGISKGTFYNYFSSKSELLIGIYKTIFKELEKERSDLLLGHDPSDIEIFIKQMELQLISNKKNKLIALYEEVMASNDVDLKQFIQRTRLSTLHWYYARFLDIFGEDMKPYLLDCAIMFQGILQHNLHYNRMAFETGEKINQVVRYSVGRLVKMVDDVAESGSQLLEPGHLEKWLPSCNRNNQTFKQQLLHHALPLRKMITKNLLDEGEQEKYLELLDFIHDELLDGNKPRKFLIESALISLDSSSLWKKELKQLEELIEHYFKQLEEVH
ncbi:TetR/AcrR family transcriptional regulator [Neobacillus vireti]|uniref:TetR/AcrR family transcriptional regulator n=1 Tax=Neobacillus vireti LMG 21834 TaxID=1131730 RepID=A0AB94IPP9_9BACI|nr:TetR/AcrR family transcriptional regulator [Neobacillus vireti]ETI68908.1 TetR/AcrR family transcriptional regulator [Neobacillus vireti LMG 21834]KLT15783.1 TetR family transcriptional regulator [Neobacillus vireti]